MLGACRDSQARAGNSDGNFGYCRAGICQCHNIADTQHHSHQHTHYCATCGGGNGWGLNRPSTRLFEVIKKRFEDAGYQMPRLVFWNVNSRTGTIPVKENDLGVALVSGFSTNVCKMVMSGKTDPYECLVETLMSDRYDAVEAALR